MRVFAGLDRGIGPRKEEGLVPAVPPPHQVRRITVRAMDLNHLAVPVRLADAVASDNDAVAHCCFHGALLSSLLNKQDPLLVVRTARAEGPTEISPVDLEWIEAFSTPPTAPELPASSNQPHRRARCGMIT